MNVDKRRQESLVAFYNRTVEAVLKKMAASGIFTVVPTDESGSEALKETGQFLITSTKQQVNMIIHQAIGKYIAIIFLLTI